MDKLEQQLGLCDGLFSPSAGGLAPESTFFFIFSLFGGSGSEQALPPPWTMKVLHCRFSVFWSVHAAVAAAMKDSEAVAEREDGPVPVAGARSFRKDVVQLLLKEVPAPHGRGVAYEPELTPVISAFCFDGEAWSGDSWQAEAERCWRLLCQRDTARAVEACAARLASLPGHEQASVSAEGGKKEREGRKEG